MRSQADYLALMQQVLPSGPAWPRDPAAALTLLLGALAQELATDDARIDALTAQFDPRTTDQMLSDWEAALGLPDSCAGAATGVTARRQQVVARYLATGGQSPAYFQALAAAYGFQVTLSTYPLFQCGVSGCGDAVRGPAWAYAWQVSSASVPVTQFTAGASGAGDPLQAWGNRLLECVIKRYAPAHTVPVFTYGTGGGAKTAALNFSNPGNSGLAAGVVS